MAQDPHRKVSDPIVLAHPARAHRAPTLQSLSRMPATPADQGTQTQLALGCKEGWDHTFLAKGAVYLLLTKEILVSYQL